MSRHPKAAPRQFPFDHLRQDQINLLEGLETKRKIRSLNSWERDQLVYLQAHKYIWRERGCR